MMRALRRKTKEALLITVKTEEETVSTARTGE